MILSKKSIVIILLFCIFVGNAIRLTNRLPKRHYADFRVYYATGKRFLNKEDIYSRPDITITPYKYSPVFAMLFSPLTFLPRWKANLVFFTINFFSTVMIFTLSSKLIGVNGLKSWQPWVLYFFTILFSSRFIMHVWDAGQVNILMLLFVLLGLYLLQKKKDAFAGASLGFAMMIKYMPAVFVPYLILKKQFKAVAWMVVFILGYCLLPALVVGWDVNLSYLQKWIPSIVGTSLDHGSWIDYKNQSIYSMILRSICVESWYPCAFLKMDFPQALSISIFIAGIIYVIALWPGRNREWQPALDYALLLLCMAMFNPNAWILNYVTFIFSFMLLIYYLMKHKPLDKITFIFMVIAFLTSSWANETMVGNRSQDFFEALSTVSLGSLILFFTLVRLKYARQS